MLEHGQGGAGLGLGLGLGLFGEEGDDDRVLEHREGGAGGEGEGGLEDGVGDVHKVEC